MTTVLSQAPRVEIGGVRICNFSSGHSFAFVGGHALMPCEDDRVQALALDREDVKIPNPKGWVDVKVKFVLSPAVQAELKRLNDDETIDVVLCPLPVISALKDAGQELGKARTIIRANRETTSGPGLIKPDEFGC